jgi:hypothetical protein
VHGHFEPARQTGVVDYYPAARQFITVLREPFDIWLSWFHYIHRNRANPLALARNPWMDQVPARLEEFIEQLDQWRGHVGGMLAFIPFALSLENFRDCLEEHFVHIGVVETLAASSVELAVRLGFCPRQVSALNRSRHHAAVSAELRAIYRRSHELEYAVYDYAVREQARAPVRRRFVGRPSRAEEPHSPTVRLLSASDCEIHLPLPTARAPSWSSLAHADAAARLRDGASSGFGEVAFGRCGAEPTTLPTLAELMGLARSFGLARQVLHTDALALADMAVARRLADSGLTDVVINVFPDSATHQDSRLRRVAVVDGKLRAVDNCLGAGLRVLIALVLMRPGLEDLPALAQHVLRRFGGSPRLGIVGRLVDADLKSRENIDWQHLRDIYAPPAELADVVTQIRPAAPDFVVVGREVPLCYPATLGGVPLVLLDQAALPLDAEPPPGSCNQCAGRPHCPVAAHCPVPGHCAVSGPCLQTVECPLLPAPRDPPPSDSAVAWQKPLLRRILASREALARAGVQLRAANVSDGGLRLRIADSAAEHALLIEPLQQTRLYYVAGPRYALSYTCACAPSTATARAILALLERT